MEGFNFRHKNWIFLRKSITKNISFVTYLTSVNIYIFSTKIQSVIRKMSSAKWLAQVLTSWVHICPELIQIALFRNVTTTKSLHVLHAAVVPTSFNCSRSTFERMSMLSKLIHTCPHSNMNVVVAFFKNSLTSQVNNFTTSQLCTIHLCICSKQIIDPKI